VHPHPYAVAQVHPYADNRDRRRSERRIKAAAFPREKSLRAFDYDANPNIDPAVMHTLATANGSARASRSA
jgi:DNA replication protein DnaC